MPDLKLNSIPREELVETYADVLNKYKVPQDKRAFIAHMIELQTREMTDKARYLGEKNTTSDVATDGFFQ